MMIRIANLYFTQGIVLSNHRNSMLEMFINMLSDTIESGCNVIGKIKITVYRYIFTRELLPF